jgi:hypothetical protein
MCRYDFDAPGFAEDKLAMLATKLKALNPEIFLVFYYNANLDLTDYRLYNLTAQHAPFWWLRNDQGKVLIAPIDCEHRSSSVPCTSSHGFNSYHCHAFLGTPTRPATLEVGVHAGVVMTVWSSAHD